MDVDNEICNYIHRARGIANTCTLVEETRTSESLAIQKLMIIEIAKMIQKEELEPWRKIS